MARNVSAKLAERKAGEAVFGPGPVALPDGVVTIAALEQAMIAGKILCYAQGFGLIVAAGREFGWDLPLPAIARVWREGCIIRSSMLNDMATALEQDPDRGLMLAPFFVDHLTASTPGLRAVIATGAMHGLPLPALSAGLAWFDMMRTGRGTANMIQGLRDFFGAHGFERLDQTGTGLHGPWGGHMV